MAVLRRTARQLFVAQSGQRIFTIATMFLVARLLGVERFGTYALLRTVMELVAVVSGSGTMDYVTREVAKAPGASWKLLIRVTQVRWAYCVPTIGAALLLLKAFHFPTSLVQNAALFSLMLFLRAAGESAQGVLKGLGHFGILPWVELLRGCVFLALSPLLIFHGFGLQGVITAEIIAVAVGAGISLVIVVRFANFHSQVVLGFRQVMASMFVFNVYPLISTLYDRIDVVLLSKLAGDFATGIYSLPYRAYSTLQIIPYGVMGALLPGFSSSQVDRDALERCARAMRFLYLIALLAVLIVVGFARPVFMLVLGPEYAASAVTLKVLVCAAIPAFMNYALNTLLLASHKEKVFVWTATTCTVFNIGANLLLIPRFSYMAAAVMTVLTEVLLLAQNCYLTKRYFGRPVLPDGWLKITLGFGASLAASLLLGRVLPEVWAGTLSCGAFAFFALLADRDVSKALAIAGRQP
jgi:O-antigen/teichoic acid export membrane protein